jgi:hypothetical protein
MQVLVLEEKHDTRLVAADDLPAAALDVLSERVADDYWYYEKDAQRAKEILEADDGEAAWEFLQRRRHAEYEYVELKEIS